MSKVIKEFLPGDRELFDMMEGRTKAVPRVAPQRPARKKRPVGRVVGSACTTMLFAAATALGYIHPCMGIPVALVCFVRLCRRIWRWRHG